MIAIQAILQSNELYLYFFFTLPHPASPCLSLPQPASLRQEAGMADKGDFLIFDVTFVPGEIRTF